MKTKTVMFFLMLTLGLAYVCSTIVTAQDEAPAPVPIEAEAPVPIVVEEVPVPVAVEVPVPIVVEEAPVPMAVEVPVPIVVEEVPGPMVVQVPVEEVVLPEIVVPAADTVVADTDQNGNGFISLPDETEPIPGVTTEKSKTAENLISITLDDVEMVDVVRMFTRISGANIIVTPSNLTGRVTVNLTDVEWKPAMESILSMHNLALVEKMPGSSVYTIIRPGPGQAEPMIVETIFLKYATVNTVNAIARSMLVPGGSVSMYPSRNALVVKSTSGNLSEIRQIIEEIDIIRDQVFIEAKFMELNDSAIRDLGINWQSLQGVQLGASSLKRDFSDERNWDNSRTDTDSAWDNRTKTDTLNNQYNEGGVPYTDATRPTVGATRETIDIQDRGQERRRDISEGFTKTVSDLQTAVLSATDFNLVLSALKTINGVTVVSNPKIVVANEEPAIIHIGETRRPFISSVTPGQQGIAPVVTYNPGDPVDEGVKLTVTPTVNTTSNITVKIEPELVRIVGVDTAPNQQTYPVISRKKINTIFCLESGKTVAIGGLTQTVDNEKTSKIPLLGDIPLIGKYLFSHSHTEKSQIETIIFVTVGLAMPEDIQDHSGLPENTRLTQRQLISDKLTMQRNQAELEEIQAKAERDSKKKAGRIRSFLRQK